MNRKLISSVLVAAGVAAVAVSSFAGEGRDAVPAAAQASAQQAWLTLDQAVTIGEARLNGRVVKAKLGGDGAAPVYKLRVAGADGQTQRIRIAVFGGAVLPETGAERHAD
jgi:uncharacterized membrane protein YkoI